MIKKERGFTLIELLVVISIVALLGAIAIANLTRSRAAARDARRLADINNIHLALELFYEEHGEYPSPSNSNFDDKFQVALGAYLDWGRAPKAPLLPSLVDEGYFYPLTPTDPLDKPYPSGSGNPWYEYNYIIDTQGNLCGTPDAAFLMITYYESIPEGSEGGAYHGIPNSTACPGNPSYSRDDYINGYLMRLDPK